MRAIFLAFPLLLMGCNTELEIKQTNTKVDQTIERIGYFSTPFEGKNLIGTTTRTHMQQVIETSSEGKKSYQRFFKGNNSTQYLKDAIPYEMFHRMDFNFSYDQKKFESDDFSIFYKKVVDNARIADAFKKELRKPELPEYFKNSLKREVVFQNLFAGKVMSKGDLLPYVINQEILKEFQVDSIVGQGLHFVRDKKCLKYEVYYQLEGPYNDLMREQVVAYFKEAAKYKNYRLQHAKGNGRYTVWIDTETGIICRIVDLQMFENHLKDVSSDSTYIMTSDQTIDWFFKG